MSTISVRQGSVFQVPITIDDETAQTVNFSAWSGDTVVIDETESFVLGEATITATADLDIGEYKYLLTITYLDGLIDVLPNDDCEGCTPPVLDVCEGVPETS